MPSMTMTHEKPPAAVLKKEVGDLSGVEVFNNQVLVAIYVRPQMTRSGIYLPDSTRDEDKFQGKVGLVLKMGPEAFVDPENRWFSGVKINVDDWIFFRPSDGWSLSVNNVPCRVLDDTLIRGRVDSPDRIW